MLICAFKFGLNVAKSAQVLPGGWTEQVAKACSSLREKIDEKGRISVINGEIRIDLERAHDRPTFSSKSHSHFGCFFCSCVVFNKRVYEALCRYQRAAAI
jgi:hypothetical protein